MKTPLNYSQSPNLHSKIAGKLFLTIMEVRKVLKGFEDQGIKDEKSKEGWLLCVGTLTGYFDAIMTLESIKKLKEEEKNYLELLKANADEAVTQILAILNK